MTSSESRPASRKKATGRFRRWLLIAVGVGALALLVLALRDTPTQVEFATVTRGPFEVILDEEGETRVRDRYTVSAPLAGRARRIELEPGDPVRAGETVLATFVPADPTPLDARSRAEARAQVRAAEAALGRARADRERAVAELELAETERRRMTRLVEDEVVSRERFDAADVTARTRREALEAARFAVATAVGELEVARARLLQGQAADGEAIELLAPIDGVVLRRLRESEAVVAAGESLLEIADPRQLEIVVDFLSTDAVRIASGMPVRIERWGGDRTLEGSVRRVEPSGYTKISALGVEEQRVDVVVDFDDPRAAWEALGDGFRVEVVVVVWQDDDVLQVPSGALFRDGGAWHVFAVADGAIERRAVDVGARQALTAQILGGLDEGETVVLFPPDGLESGAAVEPID
ncbi:MAG: efflux RND transporter periplasmic adaptor subunit [Acidobacteriota bacterium]